VGLGLPEPKEMKRGGNSKILKEDTKRRLEVGHANWFRAGEKERET